jgi:hypothetical protein
VRVLLQASDRKITIVNVRYRKMDEKERKEDLKMMKDPDTWTHWPILPMKKVVGPEMPKMGFMLATGKPVVYLTNMCDLRGLGVSTIQEVMEKVPSKEYASFEKILDDGWKID